MNIRQDPVRIELMDFLPWTTFTRIVDRYGGDHRVRTLFHLIAMWFRLLHPSARPCS